MRPRPDGSASSAAGSKITPSTLLTFNVLASTPSRVTVTSPTLITVLLLASVTEAEALPPNPVKSSVSTLVWKS